MIKDVLVFTPVLRLEPETIESIFALEWGGPLSFLFQRDNPHPEQRDKLKRRVMNHLHQFARGREVFLAGSFDAMLIIESDIIPPMDTLQKLAALDADLAYGVYRFRVSNVINIFEMIPARPRNVGESLSIRPGSLAAAVKAGIVDCSGAGFGCVLIKRDVLEQVPFRVEWPRNGGHCDTPFVRDVYRKGFTQKADMTVICGHKDEEGQVLWPELPQLN